MTEPDTGKLKTLKEIEFLSTNYADKKIRKEAEAMNEMARDKLKQEAIKWVKNLHGIMGEGGVSAFMDFFNLTEADIHNTDKMGVNK